VELAQRIGSSKIGEYCFSKEYAEYALGRHMHAVLDACTIRALTESSSDKSIQQFAVALSELGASSPRFHQ
jgi:hypothetical protein